MPSSLPPAADILAVVREFLEAAILPDLNDDKRFNVRVAANLLATVERELRLGPSAEAAEADRLKELVGADGSLEDKNQRLARAIHDGTLPSDDPRLLHHLHSTLAEALRINNPKWLGN